MPNVTVSFPQLAQAARTMINNSTVPANDTAQAMLSGVKQFLDGVASGQFVVSVNPEAPASPPQALSPAVAAAAAKVVPQATPASPPRPRKVVRAGPARGAEGVRPPAQQGKAPGGKAPPRGAEGVVPAGGSGR
jgi:hypothetical protein